MKYDPIMLFVGLIIGVIVSTVICIHGTGSIYKIEAVKHHAAYWQVDNAGNTTFKWNDEKGGE